MSLHVQLNIMLTELSLLLPAVLISKNIFSNRSSSPILPQSPPVKITTGSVERDIAVSIAIDVKVGKEGFRIEAMDFSANFYSI